MILKGNDMLDSFIIQKIKSEKEKREREEREGERPPLLEPPPSPGEKEEKRDRGERRVIIIDF